MAGHWRAVAAVWVLAAVGAILTLTVAGPAARYQGLSLALAAVVFVTFCVQLALPDQNGFVTRLVASVGGGFAILLLATVAVVVLPG